MYWVIVLYFACALAVACAQTNTTNLSSRIKIRTRRPLLSWINPHIDPINILIVDGKRFENVRGFNKFYLQVPGTNVIVFVVDEKGYSITYHVFNMDNDEDIAMHAKHSVYGWRIGLPNPSDTLYVDKAGRIVLCDTDKGAKSTLPSLANLDTVVSLYYLDVGKRAVVGEKTIYYDKSGKVIQEHDSSPP